MKSAQSVRGIPAATSRTLQPATSRTLQPARRVGLCEAFLRLNNRAG